MSASVSGMQPGSFNVIQIFPILVTVSVAAAIAFVRLYV
jgi:hypothetical protein